MILHFNYEELRALRSGARTALGEEPGSPSPVMAPTEERASVQALTLLDGDVSLESLAEVRGVLAGVEAVVTFLRSEMDSAVLATHPAAEPAVTAYFDFAHVLSVEHRLREMAGEMSALIELVTGSAADDVTARTFQFPD